MWTDILLCYLTFTGLLGLPTMMSDINARLDELGTSGTTNPFYSIHAIIFRKSDNTSPQIVHTLIVLDIH